VVGGYGLFLLGRFRPHGRRHSGKRCSFASGCLSVPSVFVSGSSDLIEQVKGWRHSDHGRLDASVRPSGRESQGNRGIVGVHGDPQAMSPGTEDPRKRQANRSDVRQEYVRLRRARTGFGPLPRAGASPPCREYLTIPAFEPYPFGFADARRMRPLSVGRVEAPFIQRWLTMARFRFHVKNMQ
jgi:hypothetical protein